MMYYRLYDSQCDRYMATGYNAHGLEDLCEQYASYKSSDWDENDQLEAWDRMSEKNKYDWIKDDEFEIETSYVPFEEFNRVSY